jgi:hypothetical protein
VPHSRNYWWAELIERVFLAEVPRCESCGGDMNGPSIEQIRYLHERRATGIFDPLIILRPQRHTRSIALRPLTE